MDAGSFMTVLCVCACRDDSSATSELNDLLYSSINDRLKSNHVNPNLVRVLIKLHVLISVLLASQFDIVSIQLPWY